MFGHDVNGDILHTRAEAEAGTTRALARRCRWSGDLESYAATFALFEAAHRKIAKHCAIASAGRRIVERAFDFDPLEGHAGHAVRPGERVDVRLLATIDAGSEKPHAIGLDHFVGAEQDLDLVDSGLGR